MRNIIATIVAFASPIFGSAAQFDSTVHMQFGTNHAEETSHMKLTGNFYDNIPQSTAMWVVSPKIYFNPSVPMDFSGSAGIKYPAGPFVLGYHAFGHFHNFGDFPVNQFGHTVEFLHNLFDVKINYYHPANGVNPISTGVISSERVDSEFIYRVSNAAITLGPVYQFSDQKWGLLGRFTFMFDSTDMGVEVNQAPGGEPLTSLFMTWKFPNKIKPKIAPRGSNSCHYTNVTIKGPDSFSVFNEEEKKRFRIVQDTHNETEIGEAK